MILRRSIALLLCVLSATAMAESESFVFYRQDTQIGRLVVEVDGNAAKVDFDIKDNGRGPTVAETLTLDAEGLPASWRITGTQTFGGKIAGDGSLCTGAMAKAGTMGCAADGVTPSVDFVKQYELGLKNRGGLLGGRYTLEATLL